MKKLFFTLLTLCLCGATFAYDFESSGIYYNYVYGDDGTTITGVEVTHNATEPLTTWPATYSGDVTIPATVSDGTTTYNVIGIGRYAFSHRYEQSNGMSSISIPEGVTYIGDYAFFGCYQMEGIDIPNSVTSIGDYAFYDCETIYSLNIGSGLETIGYGAFTGTGSISTISVAEGNTHFVAEDDVLFTADMTTLVRCAISAGDVLFGEHGEYTIPSTVTTIGSGAFSYGWIVTVNIPEGVTRIEDEAFSHGYMLSSINLPSTLEYIGNGAFGLASQWTSVITEITIPAKVKYIGGDAFAGLEHLTNVILLDDDPSDVEFGANAGVEGTMWEGSFVDGEYQWVWGDVFEADATLTLYVPTGSAAKYIASVWEDEVLTDNDNWNFNIYENGISENAGDGNGTYYATYYTDAVGEFGDDVTPCIVTGEEDGTAQYSSISGYIPAETGVLLVASAPGDTYYYHPYGVTASSEGIADVSGNMLYGNLQDAQTTKPAETGYYYYKLSRNHDGDANSVGFYWGADNGAAFTNPAGKAYLSLPSTSGTSLSGISLKKGEEDTTGISAVESASEKTVSGIYTIQGVRVSNMNQPGLYIVDGKKVLVK